MYQRGSACLHLASCPVWSPPPRFLVHWRLEFFPWTEYIRFVMFSNLKKLILTFYYHVMRLKFWYIIIQVAAIFSVVAAIYLKIFLTETSRDQIDAALEEPILKSSVDQTVEAGKLQPFKDALKKIPLPKDIMRMLKTR